MTTPYFPAVWFYVVGDTNPTTQVYSTASGLFEANTSADYLSWVANGGQTGTFYVQPHVTNAQDNGSGAIRLTLSGIGNANMTLNDLWVVQSVVMAGATVVNGTWPVTPVGSNQVDLQGSTFAGGDSWVSGGVVDRGTPIDTAAHLQTLLNSFGLTLLVTNQGFYAVNSISISGTTTLTNPMSEVTRITNTGGSGVHVVLPPMNQPNSIPNGLPFFISNLAASTGTITIYLNDRITIGVSNLQPGTTLILVLQSNQTVNGTVQLLGVVGEPILAPAYGGTGLVGTVAHSMLQTNSLGGAFNQIVASAAGNIIIDQGAGNDWLSVATSGDAALAASGAFTLASTITAGGPTGDASHVAQITYDAKGRLTAVTSVAITLSDNAITYGNESANRVFTGPSSGGAAAPTFRALVGADLPNPSSTTLGGVESLAAVSHKWINTISTSGVPSATQPASTDLSDVVSAGSWTPVDASGASLTLANAAGGYTRIGNMVFYYGRADYPVTVDGSPAKLGGLPLTAANFDAANTPGAADTTAAGISITPVVLSSSTTIQIFNAVAFATVTNAQMSGTANRFSGFYPLT